MIPGFISDRVGVRLIRVLGILGKIGFLFIVMSLCISSLAFGRTKESIDPAPPEIFAGDGLKIFTSPNTDRRMVYDFKPPQAGKPVMVFLHGLGDNMFKLQALENLAVQSGYGVLRVDLHLHGDTLKVYLRENRELPHRLDYAENTVDIAALISDLKLQDIIIIGHSYGGGIAFDLARHLVDNNPEINIESVHPLAPYVQRIDKFLKSYFATPRFMISQTGEMLKAGSGGMMDGFIDNIMQPMSNMMLAMFSGVRMMQAHVEDMIGWDAVNDLVLDPILENCMRISYERYFLMNMGKRRSELSRDEKKTLQIEVEAAIRVTKGIRGFDLLDPTTQLPKAMPPIDVIGAQHDTLVVPDQLREFAHRLRLANLKYTLSFMDGINADHLFPRRMAQTLFAKIVEFNEKHGRKRKTAADCQQELQ